MNSLLAFMAGAAMIVPSATVPRTVQGIPYVPLERNNITYSEPAPLSPGDLNFDDIKVWVGEGSNRCAFVIQFSPDDARYAYVFGYRWDGDAYGVDLVKDIVKAYPRLYGAWTDGSTYGTTINGFGWDPAMDGNFTVTLSDGSTLTPDAQGVFDGSAASFDGSRSTNTDDWWQGGWYDGYWSYWTMDSDQTSMGYSPVGASTRKLQDGCIDGWMFCPGMQSAPWKTWIAAPLANETDPSLEPVETPDPDDPTVFSDLDYSINEDGTTVSVIYRRYQQTQKCAYTGDIAIPAKVTIDGKEYTVTRIDEDAFSNSFITSLWIPNTIEEIGQDGIYDNEKLKSIKFQKDSRLKTIGRRGLAWNEVLESLTLPAGVETIGNMPFTNDYLLTEINMEERAGITPAFKSVDGVLYSADGARLIAYPCSKPDKSYDIPEGTQIIKGHSFREQKYLENITVPEGVTSIGEYAFYNIPIKSFNFPMSLTQLGGGSLMDCKNLTSITNFENTQVVSIASNTFSGSPFTEIAVPEGVTVINYNTFRYCRNLKQITLPSTVETIGDRVFQECYAMTDLYVYAEVPPTGENMFMYRPDNIYTNCTLHVPHGTAEAYKAATPWNNFANVVEMIQTGVDTIETATYSEAVYYNLQGIKVENPRNGMYIKICDGKTTKVIL